MAAQAVKTNGPAVNGNVHSGARIREASFSDYEQVAAVQSRNGLATKSRADWCALWSGNPAYLTHPSPIGWVLEASNGSVAGFLGNLPLAYRFRGRDLRAATAYSWVVDDGYRGHSIGLLDTFLKQDDVDLFVFATVNAAAEKVLRAFRLAKVPTGGWDTARFWIAGYTGFARCAMAARSMPLARLCSPVIGGALWLRDRLTEVIRSQDPSFEIEVCTEFDERFEAFWRTSIEQNRDRLLAVRDRETLAWHYRAALREGSAWIVAASRNGRLAAYWTLDRQDHRELGLTRLRFVDFQALPGFEYLLQSAVAWTLDKARRERVHVAEHLGNWIERYDVAGTVGPYRRQMKSWLFYYRARRGELAEQLKSPNVWMPSSYDGDASL
jgi:hypothetical protein